MILIIEHGRFGNQLFQFNFCLKFLKKDEKIIFLGFNELSKFIKRDKKFIFLSKNNIIIKIILRYRHFLVKIIKKLKIIKYTDESDRQKIIIKNGIFNKLLLINGFFQRENYVIKNFSSFLKKNPIENRAIQLIRSIQKNKKQKIFFVHIRLTDGITNPSKEYPAVLPLAWFFKCQNILKKKFSNCKFIYLSDDLKFLKENFKKETYIRNKELFFNFFLMKNCDGGIISPSTFSWWACYLSKKKGNFYAPKHWIGHKRKKTFPKFIETSFLKYKPVLKKEYRTVLRSESNFYKINF
jgi:hypothetical protein